MPGALAVRPGGIGRIPHAGSPGRQAGGYWTDSSCREPWPSGRGLLDELPQAGSPGRQAGAIREWSFPIRVVVFSHFGIAQMADSILLSFGLRRALSPAGDGYETNSAGDTDRNRTDGLGAADPSHAGSPGISAGRSAQPSDQYRQPRGSK